MMKKYLWVISGRVLVTVQNKDIGDVVQLDKFLILDDLLTSNKKLTVENAALREILNQTKKEKPAKHYRSDLYEDEFYRDDEFYNCIECF